MKTGLTAKPIVLCFAALLLAYAALGCAIKSPDAAAPTSAPAQIVEITTANENANAEPPADAPALQTPADALTVLFINVGKADAALVRYQGHSLLIDTGTAESAARLIGALRQMGVSSLDAVALTHTHSDHIGGMRALHGSIPVTTLYAAQISENKKNGGNKITELAYDCNLPLRRLSAGDAIPVSENVSLTVLGPLTENTDDDNDNSLVLRLSLFGKTFLFTGDMQFAEEDSLLSAGVDVRADVLKVGNHGNPDATGDAFAAAVAPSLAVISTDTSVDTDSANARVRLALAGADIRVTENTDLGVLVTLAPSGAITVSEPARPASTAQLSIESVDTEKQLVTLRNGGGALDIGGYMLLSERGGEMFAFPTGSTIASGARITISGTDGGGDYAFLHESKPWSKKKTDTAILYDRYGAELARY